MKKLVLMLLLAGSIQGVYAQKTERQILAQHSLI